MIRTIYGFDDLGRKVPTGSYDDGAKAVGGIIFYIDSNSDETVKFYDAQGAEIQSVSVGDRPSYYKVLNSGLSGKEKYYIYNDTPGVYVDHSYFPGAWTYDPTGNDPFRNGVFEVTGATGSAIGTGKSNTSTILAIRNGEYTGNGRYNGSFWYYLAGLNSSESKGCQDWYIPSENELLELYDFTEANPTLVIKSIRNEEIFSSTEVSDEYCRMMRNRSFSDMKKGFGRSALVIRSF